MFFELLQLKVQQKPVIVYSPSCRYNLDVFLAMQMNEEETAKMTLRHCISAEAVQKICMRNRPKFKLFICGC